MKEELFWKNPHYKRRPRLEEDISCKYLIVGGGILGVTLAYELQRLGIKDSVIVEKETIASGATGHAAGSLSSEPEYGTAEDYVKEFGEKNAGTYWHAHREALDLMRALVKKHRIQCEFENCDGLHLESGRDAARALAEELEGSSQVHRRVRFLSGEELQTKIHSQVFRYGIESFNGASINPLMYTQNLSDVVVKRGARIFEQSPVLRVRGRKAFTPKGTITFEKVIRATDVIADKRKIGTIVVTKKLTPVQIRKLGLKKHERFWGESAHGSYFYSKFTRDDRLLVGYGDMKTVSKRTRLYKPHIRSIEKFLKKVFPDISITLEYAWSATYGYPPRILPRVRFSKNSVQLLGAGTQPTATMLATYAANRLMGKKQALDVLFT